MEMPREWLVDGRRAMRSSTRTWNLIPPGFTDSTRDTASAVRTGTVDFSTTILLEVAIWSEPE